MLTCPCCARQVLMAVQTQQFWTSVDVPVVAHDGEMPQIRISSESEDMEKCAQCMLLF